MIIHSNSGGGHAPQSPLRPSLLGLLGTLDFELTINTYVTNTKLYNIDIN